MRTGGKRIVKVKSVTKPLRKPSYNESYNLGYDRGFNAAYDYAYQSGWEAGASGGNELFQGTSIIIVTTNAQRIHLQNCINSIYEHTPEPFEIIVIDNASTDDTASYLKSMKGKIRSKVFGSNLGFAGGTNQGLKMARGTTLLFLNNDTIVTKNWLSNMLHCLYSSAKIGLVGPITNYISGEQLIETSYTSMEEMHRFAEACNHSDSAKWHTTGRLTGFCVLMRRDMFDRLGYLDEGFEIGNCEDDDFGFRARLMGYELVIAKDTFIHHVGSVSIKALGERFEEVYGKNLEFYSKKWGDSHSLLSEVQRKLESSLVSMNHFYPTQLIVKGVHPQLYWIEDGMRRPISEELALSASRVSQVDLCSWRKGGAISGHDVMQKLEFLSRPETLSGPLREGMLVEGPDQTMYQMKSGMLQRIINDWTLSYWQLSQRGKRLVDQATLDQYEQGLPIIAPAVIVANNV